MTLLAGAIEAVRPDLCWWSRRVRHPDKARRAGGTSVAHRLAITRVLPPAVSGAGAGYHGRSISKRRQKLTLLIPPRGR